MADPTLPTHSTLYNVFLVEVQDRDPRLTDWSEGSVLDSLGGASAALADEVNAVTVRRFKQVFLDTCEGDEIDAWAADRYGDAIPRKAATSAVGTLRWSRLTSFDTSTAIPIPAGTTVTGTVDGETVSVTTDEAVTIDVGSYYAEVSATAAATGTASNVAAEVLTDSDIEDANVTNLDRFIGGTETESDKRYRARVKAYPSTLRRGTKAALREGALRVGGVVYATVSETYIDPADGGYVAVYVGDPDANGNDALAELVEEELDNWRAAGVQVQAFPSVREEIDLALAITIHASADQSAVRAAVEDAVLAYTDDLEPGGILYTGPVIAAAMGAHADIIDVDLTTPTDDVEPSAEQNALRVPSDRFTLTLTEVG